MAKAASASARLLYGIFFVWTAVGLIIMPLDPGIRELRQWTLHQVPPAVLENTLFYADAIWLWIAASCTFAELASCAGIKTAGRVAFLLGSVATLVEAIGTATGWPFGPYVYSNRLGYKLLDLVPISIPAAWFLIIVNAHQVAPRVRLRPLIVGLIAVLTDACLEMVAWHIRGYWTWYPGQAAAPIWPPFTNFISWFILAAGLDYWLLKNVVNKSRRAFPLTILILMNVLFFLSILLFHGAHPSGAD